MSQCDKFLRVGEVQNLHCFKEASRCASSVVYRFLSRISELSGRLKAPGTAKHRLCWFVAWPRTPQLVGLAYSARRGSKLLVVVDGEEGPEFDHVGRRTPVFSRDSRRVAYGVKRNGKFLLAVDDHEGKEYARVHGQPVLDGSELIRVLACHEDELFDQELLRVEIEIVEEKGACAYRRPGRWRDGGLPMGSSCRGRVQLGPGRMSECPAR